MTGLVLHSPVIARGKKLPFLSLVEYPPPAAGVSRRIISASLRCREKSRSNLVSSRVRAQASKVSIGSEGYGGWGEEDNGQPSDSLSDIEKQPNRLPHPFSMALVLFACALVFSLEAFVRGGPASPLAIGDKTFFIAALLAMQYEKGLVLLGSIGALALMTILSVVIGRIFHSVPAQFQTTLPIAKYAAVTLLLFFGLKSIKDAWNLPSNVAQGGEKSSPKLDEYFEAEELVKEKVSRRLSNPLEIVWKSFSLIFFAVLLGSVGALAVMTILSVVIGRIFHSVSTQFHTTLPIGRYAAVTLLVFFGLISIKDAWELLSNVVQGGDEYVGAEELVKEKVSKSLSNPLEIVWKSFSLVFFVEWGDRSMLVTIALGAAQCPWVVASGAIAGHLLATSSAILGGAFLANCTSEKLVGYLGGTLFLVFAVAKFSGVF